MQNDSGHVALSYELMLRLLQLEGGEIQAVQVDMERRLLLLRITHEDMPKNTAIEGLAIQPMKLTYRQQWCGHTCDLGDHILVIREPIEHWGITMQDAAVQVIGNTVNDHRRMGV